MFLTSDLPPGRRLRFPELLPVSYTHLIGYMLEEGATTIWERWENMAGGHMNSHSHPMLGAFSTWFLKGLGGIRPGDDPRKRVYELEPAMIGELTFAEASHTFMNGTLSCRWERMEDRVVILTEVPWNTCVNLKIPEPGFKIAEIIVDGNRITNNKTCLLYTSPAHFPLVPAKRRYQPRDRVPSSGNPSSQGPACCL